MYFHPEYAKARFDYTDGREVEDRIYFILKETWDIGTFSEELVSRITDWPTEYHFSPVRHNLLRHFHFNKPDRILELGCGAVTRQLGETGASVTSIDGSFHRSKSAISHLTNIYEDVQQWWNSEVVYAAISKLISKTLAPPSKTIDYLLSCLKEDAV